MSTAISIRRTRPDGYRPALASPASQPAGREIIDVAVLSESRRGDVSAEQPGRPPSGQAAPVRPATSAPAIAAVHYRLARDPGPAAGILLNLLA